MKLDTAVKSGFRKSSTYADELASVNVFNFDKDLSNEFNSKDQVHAIYANYQNQVNKFGYQIGLGAEDAQLDTRLGTYDQNSYFLTPPDKLLTSVCIQVCS